MWTANLKKTGFTNILQSLLVLKDLIKVSKSILNNSGCQLFPRSSRLSFFRISTFVANNKISQQNTAALQLASWALCNFDDQIAISRSLTHFAECGVRKSGGHCTQLGDNHGTLHRCTLMPIKIQNFDSPAVAPATPMFPLKRGAGREHRSVATSISHGQNGRTSGNAGQIIRLTTAVPATVIKWLNNLNWMWFIFL